MGFFKSWSAKITAFVTENVTDDLYLPVTIGAKLMFLVLIFLVVDFISILFWKYFSKFLVKILVKISAGMGYQFANSLGENGVYSNVEQTLCVFT